ncbi:Copper resistance protein D [Nakamurella panacisegetis]|uniref:Copper resistance protein D n=1 Tax=Nakamurella panacisegetis TaxID=1090615 RepID=A0A1H0SYD2_9ACTN|nr:copper resistance protein CopC [Nakamurella panacisegetis]SDP46591.1 Copper resistance protein D [Nakamurella panacisegetis]
MWFRFISRAAVVRLAALLGTVAALMLLPINSASAHAFLVSSSPEDGAVLTAAPEEVVLRFSESVVLPALQVHLVSGSGREFEPISAKLEGASNGDTEEPASVILRMPVLPVDAYQLRWETLSSDDLHRTGGMLIFGVGTAVSRAGVVEPAPQWDEAALRTAMFLALAAALGGWLTEALLGRGRPTPASVDRQRAARRVARWGAVAGFVFGAILPVDQLIAAGGSSPLALLQGSYGVREALRQSGFIVLAVAASAPAQRGPRAILVAVGACLTGVGTALMGHSAARGALPVTRIMADAAHLVSAATWCGGLLLAVLLIGPMLPGEDRPLARDFLRRFGVPAGACFAIMIVTGIYLTGGTVGSVDAALLTNYGRLLTLKVLIVLVIAGLALANHRRFRVGDNRPGAHGSMTLARSEAAAAVVVLLLAGLLTSGQPAREPQFVARPAYPTVPLTNSQVDDLQQTLTVRPNLPGRNVVTVGLRSVRRPAPAPVRSVALTVGATRDPPLQLESQGADTWSVAVDLTEPGPVELVLVVHRPGLRDTVNRVDWSVGADPGAGPSPVVSRAPITDLLTRTAGLMLAGLLLGGVLGRRRHAGRDRRGRPDVVGSPVDAEVNSRLDRPVKDAVGS